MTIAYRPAELGDRDFVVSAWSSSFKRSHFAGLIWTDDWAAIMHPQITRALELPGVRAVIAYENTDPDFVYGFIAGDTTTDPHDPVVLYVYVKEPYRKAGYARGLFAALGVDPEKRFTYVCRTGFVSRLKDKIPRGDWNPLVARYPREQRKDHGQREVIHQRRR